MGPGAKGRGGEPFVAVTWDEVLERIAAELSRVRDDFGNSAIFGGSYGWASAGRFHHAQSQLKRFLNCAGGFTSSVNTYSFAAAEVMIPHVLGSYRDHLYRCTAWSHIVEHTRTFVAFGGIPLKNGQVMQGGGGRHIQRDNLRAAVAKGVEFVNISPLRNTIAAEVGAEWMPLRPCTDTALILALCSELICQGLVDRPFLDRYTQGFEPFAAYLAGECDGVPKTAQWAAELCELDARDIRALARRMAQTRTMISLSWSLTRQHNGEQPFWAAIALAAMLGQIGLPGGGFGFGYSAVNSVGNGLAPLPMASFPQGHNPVQSFIPVARISDMLLNPGGAFSYEGEKYSYPDIRLLWWAGGNPFHHHQDLWRLQKAWEKPETVIVNDWCWTATARRADIVLPCTTALERRDLALTPRNDHVVSMDAIFPPVGQARDDHEIFLALARKMGFEQTFSAGLSAEDWQRRLYDDTRRDMAAEGVDFPTYADFREQGWFQFRNPRGPAIMMEKFRQNPVDHPLNTPSGRIEIFSEQVASFGDGPGHPFWHPPREWLGASCVGQSLHLITHQPADKLHSQLDHSDWCQSHKIKGRTPVLIHPQDAQRRGLDQHDLVRVFNARGACLAGLEITDAVRPGVVVMATGAWFDPCEREDRLCRHGNPNALTADLPTSAIAQGPAANSCLVDLVKYDGIAPEVKAFYPPKVE